MPETSRIQTAGLTLVALFLVGLFLHELGHFYPPFGLDADVSITSSGGGPDAFVTKLNAAGSAFTHAHNREQGGREMRRKGADYLDGGLRSMNPRARLARREIVLT